MWKHGSSRRLTCQSVHDDAPPDAPAPPNETEDYCEELSNSDDEVHAKGADSVLRSVLHGEPWLSAAEAEDAAQEGTCKGTIIERRNVANGGKYISR